MTALPIYRALYGARPSDYQGEFQRPVAEVREPLRLLSYQRTGNGLLVEVMDGDKSHQFYAAHADHGELMRLGDFDRATLQAALIQMAQQDGGPPDAA